MALNPGTRIGAYEIVSAIGAGGMGEVYRGRDTRLKRDVAIKVLPDAFTSDPERLARFQREAELLATLNHPNIAQIYGLEDRALILELVDGPTLADRIAQGPIPLDEALPIANQIADALEAAHEHGIIHRDLKPANIKVRPDGTVKILDFGLAKATETSGMPMAGSLSPTITSPAIGTAIGMLLGTAAYMAPEQARGKIVDKRTDIWAFGCIVYEMMSGTRPFDGETVTDTLAKVIERDPDLRSLPQRVRSLVQACLQKDPKRRLHDMGDAQLLLDNAPSVALSPQSFRWSLRAVALVAVLVVGGGGVLLMWRDHALRQSAASESAVPSWTGALLGGPDVAWGPRVSPDGKSIAFIAMVSGLTQAAVMNPESGNWTTLTKDRTRGYVSRVSWSRDGSRIFYNRYYDVPLGVFSIPALGGEERLVLDNANGAELLPDGSLLVGRINANRQMQIHRYWPADGRLQALPGFVTNQEAFAVRAFPDGRRAAFWGRSSDQPSSDQQNQLYLLDLTTAKVEKLGPTITSIGGSSVGSNASALIAVMPKGQAVIVAAQNGDLTRLLAIDLRQPDRPRTLLDLQERASGIEVGPDGSLYFGQSTRPPEVWRFTSSGSSMERVSSFPQLRTDVSGLWVATLHTPDGATLIPTTVAGRRRMLLAAPDSDPAPFIETDLETDSPSTLVGNDRVALMIGSGTNKRIAIASLQDGRIVKRIDQVKADSIKSVVASPDGKTLYFVDTGAIWSASIDGGLPQKIRDGDGVAVSPDGTHLIIQLVETTGVRWLKVNLDGSAEQAIRVSGDVRFTFAPVGPGAVSRDGKIVLPVAVRDSWYWKLAVFDPRTGDVRPVPLPVEGDPSAPAWTPDGKIIVALYPIRSSLWRFRPIDRSHAAAVFTGQ